MVMATSSHIRLLLLLLLTPTCGSALMTSYDRRRAVQPTSRVVNIDDPCKAGLGVLQLNCFCSTRYRAAGVDISEAYTTPDSVVFCLKSHAEMA